jgi:hypothetical protein
MLGGIAEMPFLEGRTTISFATGLDPQAAVAVYVLGKVPSGESIKPSVKMYGEPGVLFKEENAPPSLAMPDTESLSQPKLNITPLKVRVVTVSDKVLLFWDTSTCSNYSGVKAFRSKLRRIGDFADVGDKVFDGFGSTNAFELERIPDASWPGAASANAPDYQQHFDHAPVDPRLATLATPRAPTVRILAPPSNLKVIIIETIKGFAHFIDTPPERDVAFTYTVYAFDRAGNQSYPVVVNAVLDSSATNCVFRLLP